MMLQTDLMDALEMVKSALIVLPLAPLGITLFGVVVTSVCTIKIGKAFQK